MPTPFARSQTINAITILIVYTVNIPCFVSQENSWFLIIFFDAGLLDRPQKISLLGTCVSSTPVAFRAVAST